MYTHTPTTSKRNLLLTLAAFLCIAPSTVTAQAGSWVEVNGTMEGTNWLYPDELAPSVNHNDVVVFDWFSNFTDSTAKDVSPVFQVYGEDASGQGTPVATATVVSTVTVSAVGSFSYTFTPYTTYPYTAMFGLAMENDEAHLTNYMYISVTSTAGAPKTYVSGATTASSTTVGVPTGTTATTTAATATTTSATSSSSPAGSGSGSGAGIGAEIRWKNALVAMLGAAMVGVML